MNTAQNPNTAAFADMCIYLGYPMTIVDIAFPDDVYLIGYKEPEYLDEIP